MTSTRRPARYLAQCPRGLEVALSSELRVLGCRDVETVGGGALFAADAQTAARVLVWVRTAVRILEPVALGPVRSFDDVYELASTAAWEDLVGEEKTFAVRASVSRSSFNDRHFAALRVKDAIADRTRARRGRRPSVDRQDPDVPIRLLVRGDEARLYRDLAGESLHRRGHRPIQVKSPLSEVVAAGLLMLAEWKGESSILDPMCGSGTFVVEAAAIATNRAPGLDRAFAAERFPDANKVMWRRLREEAREQTRDEIDVPIFGSDRHPGAIGIARRVVEKAGLQKLVRLEIADAAKLEPPFPPELVVANPPWGGRLGDRDLEGSWRALGTFLRRCPGAGAYVLSGAPELTRHLGLKASRRWPVRIGRFDARWLCYEIREAGDVERTPTR